MVKLQKPLSRGERIVSYWPLAAAALLAAIPVLLWVSTMVLPTWDRTSFIKQWTETFHAHHQFGAVGEQPPAVEGYRFPDGSTIIWVLECECGGGSFDATVVANQSGEVYWTTDHVCGYEELGSLLRRDGVKGFGDFLAKSGKHWTLAARP